VIENAGNGPSHEQLKFDKQVTDFENKVTHSQSVIVGTQLYL
jgi:hypothetical protein